METDFSKINGKKVGYKLVKHTDLALPTVSLDSVTFKEFIQRYPIKDGSYRKVYTLLESELINKNSHQDKFLGERFSQIEVLLELSLEKESIYNAMRLIQENYL